MAEKTYNTSEIETKLAAALQHWYYENGHICRVYRGNGWKSSVLALGVIAHLAEAAWHHPEVIITYPNLTVKLMTHSADGVTDKDFELAQKIEDTVQWQPSASTALRGTPSDPRFKYLEYD